MNTFENGYRKDTTDKTFLKIKRWIQILVTEDGIQRALFLYVNRITDKTDYRYNMLNKYGIKIVFKPQKKISQFLRLVRDKTSLHIEVYMIFCVGKKLKIEFNMISDSLEIDNKDKWN